LTIGLRLLVIFALVSFGCAPRPAASVLPPAVDVTGRWTGSWTIPGRGSGDAWVTLQQSGAKVTGEIRITGTPDNNPGGPVEGMVEGNALTFIWTNRNGQARGEFTVTGEEMTGSTELIARLQWKLTRTK